MIPCGYITYLFLGCMSLLLEVNQGSVYSVLLPSTELGIPRGRHGEHRLLLVPPLPSAARGSEEVTMRFMLEWLYVFLRLPDSYRAGYQQLTTQSKHPWQREGLHLSLKNFPGLNSNQRHTTGSRSHNEWALCSWLVHGLVSSIWTVSW